MNDQENILLVDDDSDALLSLARALKATSLDVNIEVASSKGAAITALGEVAPVVVVLDLSLCEREGVESGFFVLKKAQELLPYCRVIILTGHGDIEYGVKALNLGAASFLEKPAKIDHLAALIKDGQSQARIKKSYLELERDNSSRIEKIVVGQSSSMIELRKELDYASSTKQPVLITGPTGTGKSLCARAIHDQSSRHDGSFIRFQPSLQSAELVASELFGHSTGAFTGADKARTGLLRAANGGTLFLDEVDELPSEIQVSLLGSLQDKTFRPLGSDKEETSDFRLISASNADVDQCVESGKLRTDFFHRVAHFRIRVPALAERLDDIEILVSHFLKTMQLQEELSVCSVSDEAFGLLRSYEWPGNIRELSAVIENACYRAEYQGRQVVTPEDIQLGSRSKLSDQEDFHSKVRAYKKKLVQETLDRNQNNQVKAAEQLGIDRSTLRRVLS